MSCNGHWYGDDEESNDTEYKTEICIPLPRYCSSNECSHTTSNRPDGNKKTGEVVYPSSGFNVIATANTKGRGSEEGRYLSQILDDAFLERFPITVEQEYPDAKTERKILTPLIEDKDFVE